MLSSTDILKTDGSLERSVSWRGLDWQPTWRRLPVRLLLCLLIIVLIVVKAQVARTQQQFIDREYQIKAACLYNFAKYVRWPDTIRPSSTEQDEFVIALAGSDPFRGALQQIAGTHTIQGRSIRIVIVHQATDARNCQLLFVPRNRASTFDMRQLQTDKSKPILIVGETDGFAQTGGMINFYMEDNRVKFEINSEAAGRVGLQISAKLLQLGRSVRTATANNSNAG